MTAVCTLFNAGSTFVNRSLFDYLHPQGRELIIGWARRGASVPHDGHASDYFEGFIYLWFAVNGWGACVTGTDSDRQWVDELAKDHELAALFAQAIGNESDVRTSALRFAGLWPIFRSSEIRRRGIVVPPDCSRRQRVQIYLENHITHEPTCWQEHDGKPPLDWGHTFKTLYRVRCNLFHGEKTLDSENDRDIVRAGYSVLLPMARLLELLG